MNKYINKQLKIREENLKYDFLPSMLEIIERPASKLANRVLYIVIALIITTIIWAEVFRIDVAVTAVGAAMPQGDVIVIDSVYGGMVEKICVKEGGSVKKGDTIIALDDTEAKLNVSEGKYNLEVMEVQYELYKKLYKCMDENKEFKVDINEYKGYESFAEAIVLEHDTYEKKLSYISGVEKNNYEQEYKLSILQNINTLESQIYSGQKNLEKAKKQYNNLKIKAPISGKISQMSVMSEGTLVTAGETVGYVVPSDKENVFTAYVADEDIGYIKKKDKVSVKITAYDNTKYEYMKGTVISVCDVALNMESIGASYMVKIRIKNLPEDAKSGMEGNCYIITGTRTVLDYFLEPFKEGLEDSLKER